MAKQKTDTTATDLAPVKTVSDAEAKAFKLDPHLIKLMWDEPFFSKILRGVTKVRTDSIPTAGVLAKDGALTMWWNPKFVAGLATPEVKGLLKHECYHLVFEHTTTRRHEPHTIWNYAADLAINSLIVDTELPEGGLIPGQAFKKLSDPDRASMGPERVRKYEAVSAKIASLPKDRNAEWYFGQLMDDEEVKDAIQNPGDPSEGQGEGETNGPGLPGPMDDHDGWDELSDEERELMKGKIKQALKDAVNECDKSGQWGSISGEARKTLREMVSNEIPWQSVLKQFCGLTRRANRHSNVRRLSRKYPGIHPGVQKGYTASIAVYIDQSGSVSDGELELLFAELRGLTKNVQFVVYHFDTEVDEASETEWRKGKTPVTHRTRCGGTCFKAPSDHANKNKHRFDGYLILTDGGAADPGPSRLRRGWVVTPGQELYFQASKQDFVINMKQLKNAS
jgi:predicted metal-dependent peptidase